MCKDPGKSFEYCIHKTNVYLLKEIAARFSLKNIYLFIIENSNWAKIGFTNL